MLTNQQNQSEYCALFYIKAVIRVLVHVCTAGRDDYLQLGTHFYHYFLQKCVFFKNDLMLKRMMQLS